VSNFVGRFRLEGQGALPPERARRQSARVSAITPGYFRTMGIRLMEGRNFDERDRAGAPGVAMVSQSMARTFWPESPSVLGKRLVMGTPPGFSSAPPRTWEIVGVVADARQWPDEVSGAHIYLPESQAWEPTYSELELSRRLLFHVVIRTQGEPLALAQAVRNAIREVDPAQPADQIATMEDRIALVSGPRRSTMLLLGLFAGVAVLLAAIGIYGVISYSVSQRTHELGVRLALGAGRGEVLRLVMRGGLLLALAGILIGSVASYWLTRLIAAQLYEVSPTDPLTFVLVAGVLLAVALLACYLPARRAAALDPMAALRSEG
jgi:putative ABC transport system permease protein